MCSSDLISGVNSSSEALTAHSDSRQIGHQNYAVQNSSVSQRPQSHFVTAKPGQTNTSPFQIDPNYTPNASWVSYDRSGTDDGQAKVENHDQIAQSNQGSSRPSNTEGNAPDNTLDQFLAFEEVGNDLNMPDYGQDYHAQDFSHEFFNHDVMH